VYLVNRKRTASRSKRNLIVDNIVDGIKCALLPEELSVNRKKLRADKSVPFPYYAFRA
jgi:hypothetical protein